MSEQHASGRERRQGDARSVLDDEPSRRATASTDSGSPSTSEEEGRSSGVSPGASAHNPNRQTVLYCPYCGEETLFPAEKGWECRSCLRAFSVSFLGLVAREGLR